MDNKELSLLLTKLCNQNLFDAKNKILSGIDTIRDALNDVENQIKCEMHKCIEEDRLEDINKLKKIKEEASSVEKTLAVFNLYREDKKYPTGFSIEKSHIDVNETDDSERQNEILLTDKLEFTKPYRIRIGPNIYENSPNKWLTLMKNVCDILAGMDSQKFTAFTNEYNKHGYKMLYFGDPNGKNAYYIKSANLHLIITSCNAVYAGGLILEALRFFGYGDDYGVYVFRGQNNRQGNVEEEDETEELVLGSNIMHNKYGEGTITSIDEQYFTVDFGDVEKMFPRESVNEFFSPAQ